MIMNDETNDADEVDEIGDDGIILNDGRYLSYECLANAIQSILSTGQKDLPDCLINVLQDCKYHF